jgi:hypothetical protein
MAEHRVKGFSCMLSCCAGEARYAIMKYCGLGYHTNARFVKRSVDRNPLTYLSVSVSKQWMSNVADTRIQIVGLHCYFFFKCSTRHMAFTFSEHSIYPIQAGVFSLTRSS